VISQLKAHGWSESCNDVPLSELPPAAVPAEYTDRPLFQDVPEGAVGSPHSQEDGDRTSLGRQQANAQPLKTGGDEKISGA